MSAANATAPSPTLEEEMRAHEPSMEEILASIRRIIADDDSLPGVRRERESPRRVREPEEAAPAVEPPPPAQSAYPAPALDRREAQVAIPVAEPRAEEASIEEPVEREAAPVAEIRQLRVNRVTEEAPVADYDAAEPEENYDNSPEVGESYARSADETYVVAENDAPLMSPDAASSIASHFQALAASMVINDSGLLHKYAQEMLRPMLKQWLDDNLPVIVERLVRAEIERVARGGRR
ncbi:DUF2497 domain-containing protein [Methylocystis sp. WRRC1]|uniref:PopZ family protein n=1 Tax=Methylocystis sp. WRRC1 TaxID=1732014 RepID=UPI001D152FEF|nr:DUF2497 domain-containing protein [Methylocystis sp. WRRC1]MCC3243859.1 DUF2497 domain-containing protein [Methylocystis sp. WRRC1]